MDFQAQNAYENAMPLTYCGNLVRQADPDRFLISLLMPRKFREGLWALFAFNAEIAKTRSVVTETQMGLIRLTWWREAIEEIYNNDTPRSHPVVEDLAGVIEKYNLDKDLFLKLLYAREFDLEDVPPGTVDGLKTYAQATNNPLLKLGLQVLGQNDTEEVINRVAEQYGITGLIRSVLHMSAERRCYLPDDLLKKYDLSAQKLYDFSQKEVLPQILKELIGTLDDFQNVQSSFLRAHTGVSQIYLRQLKKCEYDLYDPHLALPPPFMALRLWGMTR